MGIKWIFFVLSFFLAKQSNFEIFLLSVIFIYCVAFYFKIFDSFKEMLKENLIYYNMNSTKIVKRIFLYTFYILSLFLVISININFKIMSSNNLEKVVLFFLIFVPLLILVKLSYKNTIYLTLFFIFISALALSQKMIKTAEFTSIEVFLLLTISYIQIIYQGQAKMNDKL